MTIPPDAKAVRFWDHWHDRIVVFETSEKNFRAMFAWVKFEEIRERRTYPVTGFGDPSAPPWRTGMTREVANGIVFEKIAKNGGGETILYDRASGTGYYCYAAW